MGSALSKVLRGRNEKKRIDVTDITTTAKEVGVSFTAAI